MPGRGLDVIPLKIPEQWSAEWFRTFVRDVLALADARNAIPGTGVEIEGSPSTPAEISTDADISALTSAPFVTVSSSSVLSAERVLTAGTGISIVDAGAGATITVSVNDVPLSELGDIPELSVLGNQVDDTGPIGAIGGTAQYDVLAIHDDGSGGLFMQFGPIDHNFVSDFDEAAQDAVGTILVDSGTINFAYTDVTPAITAVAITQMSVTSDSSGLMLENDEASPGNSKVYATDGSGVKGWFDASGDSLVYGSADASTVANTAAEAAFTSTYTVPVAYLALGYVLRGEAYGVYGTDSSPPTLRIRVKLNTTTVLDSTAFTTTASMTNRGWRLEFEIAVTIAGTSGEVESQGILSLASGTTSAQAVHLSNTATVAVDIDSDSVLEVTAQWGTADSDNTITMRTFLVNAETMPIPDPDYVALLHFDGSDGSTTFTDEYGNTWTASGDAQLDTAQFKFGTASLLLDGTGDFVDSTSADYVWGTGDFTLEGFVRFNALSGNNFVFTLGGGVGLYTFSSQWAVFDGGAGNLILGGTTATGVWYHWALCRSGTSLRLFIDGVQTGSTATNSTNFSSNAFRLGAQPGGTGLLNGWIDEVRLTADALYTSNFTPPSAPFPDP